MATKYHTVGDLVIELDIEASPMHMTWRGRSLSQFMSSDLITFVDRVFDKMRQDFLLEVDVSKLEHANSQAIGFLTGFIGRAFLDRTAPTLFVYNPDIHFQKSLFAALIPMLPERPHVKFKERA